VEKSEDRLAADDPPGSEKKGQKVSRGAHAPRYTGIKQVKGGGGG